MNILYLNKERQTDIEDNIKFLESCLQEYRSDEEIPQARKLIQKGFKELIENTLKKE